MNPQECVWEIHYQIIMKTILQEKETIHLQAMKIPAAKGALDMDWENFEVFGVEPDKSEE